MQRGNALDWLRQPALLLRQVAGALEAQPQRRAVAAKLSGTLGNGWGSS
jgi:hypothetical protein